MAETATQDNHTIRAARVVPRGAWAFAILLGAILPLVVLSGCGLFSIRDAAEPPTGTGEHSPNEPDSVLLNLVMAIEEKQSGLFIMRNALADTFKFELDPSVAQPIYGKDQVFFSRTETESGWLSFLNTVVGEDSITIEFDTDAATKETPDNTTTLYHKMPYLLTTWTGPGAEAAQARGTVDLYFKLAGSGNWAITHWVDKLGDDKQIPSLGSRIEPGSGHTET